MSFTYEWNISGSFVRTLDLLSHLIRPKVHPSPVSCLRQWEVAIVLEEEYSNNSLV